jgi:hypothetical protein
MAGRSEIRTCRPCVSLLHAHLGFVAKLHHKVFIWMRVVNHTNVLKWAIKQLMAKNSVITTSRTTSIVAASRSFVRGGEPIVGEYLKSGSLSNSLLSVMRTAVDKANQK